MRLALFDFVTCQKNISELLRTFTADTASSSVLPSATPAAPSVCSSCSGSRAPRKRSAPKRPCPWHAQRLDVIAKVEIVLHGRHLWGWGWATSVDQVLCRVCGIPWSQNLDLLTIGQELPPLRCAKTTKRRMWEQGPWTIRNTNPKPTRNTRSTSGKGEVQSRRRIRRKRTAHKAVSPTTPT